MKARAVVRHLPCVVPKQSQRSPCRWCCVQVRNRWRRPPFPRSEAQRNRAVGPCPRAHSPHPSAQDRRRPCVEHGLLLCARRKRRTRGSVSRTTIRSPNHSPRCPHRKLDTLAMAEPTQTVQPPPVFLVTEFLCVSEPDNTLFKEALQTCKRARYWCTRQPELLVEIAS